MAIADLLWACPVCREVASIQPHRRGERCSSCRTEFRRGSGADIVARLADGSRRVAAAPVWFDELPPLDPASPHVTPAGPGRSFSAPATAKLAGSVRPLRRRRRLIGWFEVFGPAVEGELRLDDRTVAFRPGSGRSHPGRGRHADPAAGWEWPLESLRVLQPSSSSIQIRHRDGTLVSLRFPGGSTLLWEVRFQAALRACYTNRGLGEIREFQPRICTR